MTALIISSICFVVLFLLALINFASAFKNIMTPETSMEDSWQSISIGLGLHAIFGGLAFLAFLGMVASALWMVTARMG